MPAATPASNRRRAATFATPLDNDKDYLDAVHDDTPLRYRTMDDILGDQTETAIVQHDIDVDVELHLMHTGESCAFA